MWRRKTPDEKEADTRRLRTESQKLGLPALLAVGTTGIISFCCALGAHSRRSGYNLNPPLTFDEGRQRFQAVFFVLLPLAFLFFVIDRRSGRWDRNDGKAQICTSCYLPQAPSTSGCRKCGQPPA